MQPGQAGDHAVGGPSTAARQPELVAIGLGVEIDHHPVVRGRESTRLDHRAAAMNVGLGGEPDHLLMTGDRLAELEPIDAQRPDMDVEAGQDRPAGLALQLGQAIEDQQRRGQAGDVELVVRPGEGVPVEADLGRFEELAP